MKVSKEALEILGDLNEWKITAQPHIDDPGVSDVSNDFLPLTQKICLWCDEHSLNPAVLMAVCRQIIACRRPDSDGWAGSMQSPEKMRDTYRQALDLFMRIENIAKQPEVKSDVDLEIAISELPAAQQIAYRAYECAMRVDGIKTYKDAYKWINETYPEGDYALPQFTAWRGNLIRARKNIGKMKNTSRSGRGNRNIVQQDQI